MSTPLTSAEVGGAALLESLQAAASTPSASSTAAVAARLSACLAHAADLPYSILSDPLAAAITAGQLDAARQILQHNTQHLEQYAHSDGWTRSPADQSRFEFSREFHLDDAMEFALHEGHSELLPAIHAAGLTHTDSSFAEALVAPTRAARVAGLRMATELWGWPKEAYVDLWDELLSADAPECLVLRLRHEVMERGGTERGGTELASVHVEDLLRVHGDDDDRLSESNRQMLRRVQAGLPPFETPP